MNSSYPRTAARVPVGSADAETALGYLLDLDWDLLGTPKGDGLAVDIRKNNSRRAGWALCGVKGYSDITTRDGARGEPVGQQMVRLAADLVHLCDALGVDFRGLADYAFRNYYLPEVSRAA